jgi:GNAT superfamily N-acetyltransferase
MPAQVAVRAAVLADRPAVLALLAELNDDDPALTDADATELFTAMLAQPGRTVLVAEVEGAVCGTADCAVLVNLTRGGRPFMVIENVVVAARRRRRGIGGALMSAAAAVAREAGCYKAQLITDDFPETVAFYERCGFVGGTRGFKRSFGHKADERDRRRLRYGA